MNKVTAITSILLAGILTNNMVLSKFLGICPFLGVSKKVKTAFSMSIAVTLVMVIATAVTWPIDTFVLKQDYNYLQTVVFILVIAAIVQLIEIVLKKYIPPIYKALGIYLPLITTNCAVLGVALKAVNNDLSFGHMLLYAFGSGIGFLLVMYIFSLIREELDKRNVPKAMRGVPIALIVASILAILFSRYVGISPKEKEIKLENKAHVIEVMEEIPSEKYFEDLGGTIR